MSYIIIPHGDGVVTHRNVDPDRLILPDNAEVYDTIEGFRDRLSDFDNS